MKRPKPGLPVSAAVHAGLLLAMLVAFSDARKFDDAKEVVAIDIVTDAAVNEVMKGEKSAKEIKPAQRAEKLAATPETKPLPPLAEAKKDISAPPPPLRRRQEEPEDKPEAPPPPKRAAALPAKPEPAKSEPPKPEPPARPSPPKAEPAKVEPPKVEPPKPEPPKPPVKAAPSPPEKELEEAEVVRPKPPPRPVPEKVEKAEKPDKPEKPTKTEAAQPPDRPKPKEEPRLKVDEVAKLLERKKTTEKATEKAPASDQASDSKSDKPAAKPKSGDETAPKSKFDAASIANLLSREAPQRRAATGKELTKTASLGAPTANAARMSPTLQAQIDAYTVEHYRKCWAAALALDARSYVPRVEFRLTRQGALEGAPRLLNPSSVPVERSRGEQALAAVRRCSPMPIPPAFDPFYDYWRLTELDMREDM